MRPVRDPLDGERYMRRCQRLMQRGLSGRLLRDLVDAGDWEVLESMEKCDDAGLRRLAGLVVVIPPRPLKDAMRDVLTEETPMGERDDPPRLYVQKTGLRGWQAWETWVEQGLSEYGTYAWTRKQAERKGRRLMAKWQRLHAADATREEIRVDG